MIIRVPMAELPEAPMSALLRGTLGGEHNLQLPDGRSNRSHRGTSLTVDGLVVKASQKAECRRALLMSGMERSVGFMPQARRRPDFTIASAPKDFAEDLALAVFFSAGIRWAQRTTPRHGH